MPHINAAKVMEMAKGFRGRAKNCITIARTRVERAMQYQYRNRKIMKRDFRRGWISQINAGVREFGGNYSGFMHRLSESNVQLNRKMLANLAEHEPLSFRAIVEHTNSLQDSSIPIATPKTFRDFGHVMSTVQVTRVPVGKMPYRPKARRSLVNYY